MNNLGFLRYLLNVLFVFEFGMFYCVQWFYLASLGVYVRIMEVLILFVEGVLLLRLWRLEAVA